jgi:hypothetical protein
LAVKLLKSLTTRDYKAFFQGFELNYPEIAKIVVGWMNIPQPWVLSLDRTTWEFGDHCYNILTLGLVHEGVAIPNSHIVVAAQKKGKLQ